MPFRFRNSDPRLVYYVYAAVMELAGAVAFTTYIVYYYKTVGMSPLQLVLVGTVLEGAILLLEVPTGVLADTFSRRLSVTLGVFLLGAHAILVGLLPTFGAVLLAQVVAAFGYTFMSGAIDAWLADEVGEEQVGPVYIRSGQINRVAVIIGTLGGAVIASLALNITFVAGGVIWLLMGVFLALAMPETGFQPGARRLDEGVAGLRQATSRMLGTFRDGMRAIRAKPILLTLVLVSLFVGAASEGFDRLGDAHLLDNIGLPAIGSLDPVLWFGIMGVTGSLIGLLVTESVRKRMESITTRPAAMARALVALKAGGILASLAFVLAGSFPFAFVVLQARGVLHGLSAPLYNTWLVQNIQPRVRATVMSMVSQGNALGQTIFGPAVGVVGNGLGLRAALGAATLLLVPEVILYGRVAARGELDASPPDEPPVELAPALEPES